MSRSTCNHCGRKRDLKFMRTVPLNFVTATLCTTPTKYQDRFLNKPSCYMIYLRELSVDIDSKLEQIKDHLDSLPKSY